MIGSKKLDVESLVVKSFTLDELPKVFKLQELLAQGKIIIKF